jgi:hypothetical protein
MRESSHGHVDIDILRRACWEIEPEYARRDATCKPHAFVNSTSGTSPRRGAPRVERAGIARGESTQAADAWTFAVKLAIKEAARKPVGMTATRALGESML